MTKTQPEPGYVQAVTPRLDHAPSRGSGHARCLRDPVLSAGSRPSSFCFTTPHGECVYGPGEGGSCCSQSLHKEKFPCLGAIASSMFPGSLTSKHTLRLWVPCQTPSPSRLPGSLQGMGKHLHHLGSLTVYPFLSARVSSFVE